MISQTDLAAMLCSRLCHDMLSPVGALANGLELLADEQDAEMRARCMELLEQSARISTDKLKFFRLAFGAAGGFGEAIPIDEAKSVIDALAADNKRVTINWAIAEPSLPKPAIKVLLNLAQIALDSLVRGGTLDIGAERRDGAVEIVARA
ncbi:MAG: histidine phosphotransferase, partial [Erythrobacter sp.]|nr:histidine phosphotransferase [Erythrobacter sp.]